MFNQTAVITHSSLASQSAEVLATFSTLGFVILLALPTLIGARWDLLKGKGDFTVLFDPAARFQGSFTSGRVHNLFIVLSLAFLASGIMLLFEFIVPSELIAHFSVITQFVSMAASFIAVGILYIKSHLISKTDLETTIQYITAKPLPIPSVTIKRKGSSRRKKKGTRSSKTRTIK